MAERLLRTEVKGALSYSQSFSERLRSSSNKFDINNDFKKPQSW